MRAGPMLRALIEALAVAWVLGLLVIFFVRIGFPLELEWMEGGVLHQASRLQHGEALYPPPSTDFVPFLYTPLYAVLVAALGFVAPLSLAMGRAVSIAAWIAILLATWRAVAREGKPRFHRAAAVALVCAGYVFTFRWLDLARPDTLYMALTLWGLVLLRESWGSYRKAIAAGVLIALGFWTKQTAATFIIASAVGALIVAPKQLWAYALTIAVIDGGGVLIGNAVTDGWLWTYIYELHQQHAFNEERFTTKTWGMFLHAAPWMCALAVGIVGGFALPWLSRRRKLDARTEDRLSARLSASRGLLYWGLMAATGLAVSALGYATQWAEPNAFIPGVCMGAIFVAVGMPAEGRAATAANVLVALQLVQSAILEPLYQPIQAAGLSGIGRSFAIQDLSRTVPSEADERRAAALRSDLETAPGEILALHRPWWSVIAGGNGHVGTMGLNDVEEAHRAQLQEAIRAQVRAGRYAQLWFEGDPPAWLRRALEGYRVERRLQGPARVRPFSGYMSPAGMVTPYKRDQVLMVPVAARPAPPGGVALADFEDGTVQGFSFEGRAFGRRPVRSMTGKLPPVGPFGGEFLLSSAGERGRLRDTGTATSPPFTLPDAGSVQMLLGAGGDPEGLSVVLIDESGDHEIPLAIPKGRWVLGIANWDIEAGWGGGVVRVRLRDESEGGALFFDDLWVVGIQAEGT